MKFLGLVGKRDAHLPAADAVAELANVAKGIVRIRGAAMLDGKVTLTTHTGWTFVLLTRPDDLWLVWEASAPDGRYCDGGGWSELQNHNPWELVEPGLRSVLMQRVHEAVSRS